MQDVEPFLKSFRWIDNYQSVIFEYETSIENYIHFAMNPTDNNLNIHKLQPWLGKQHFLNLY